MKFSEALLDTLYRITAYDHTSIQVNGLRLSHPFWVTAHMLETNWVTGEFKDLQATDLITVLAKPIDILIIGCGWQHSLPSPEIHRTLVQSKQGFEIMDTAAACRTFNLLLTESRAVAAALFL